MIRGGVDWIDGWIDGVDGWIRDWIYIYYRGDGYHIPHVGLIYFVIYPRC